MDSAARGSSEIAVMKYSVKQKTDRNNSKHIDNQKITCYNCGNTGSMLNHVKEKYPARSTKCY